ncbi:serine/threonine-protein kinase SRPK3 [Viridothelium virens]|uniref:EKC/KEOPS complex subunit BUD32 n=1 Tax=Viridothelium virens TaxID=1048519 RepID=A0A6A6GYH2_VIRVR|nr:serine/threonine-protein kinase SRPK3 [Viridothelium virens]
MSSPPLTPSVELPRSSKGDRFLQTGTACEWSEEYRPNGLHPIHFGDTFKENQYTVIRKLGNGAFSTVWLALDKLKKRYAALKVTTAKSSPSIDKELAIYQQLSRDATSVIISKYFVTLLDHFKMTGPNGTHQCLVYEPMGPTAASMRNHLGENKVLRPLEPRRYPKWMAKIILKQTLTGLEFLHKHGIVHSDLSPGNILFSIPSLDAMKEGRLKQNEAGTTDSLRRLDGKQDKWAPRYLAVGQSLHEYVNIGPNLQVKISDLASAFFAHSPPKSVVTPLGLRAPELIFHEPAVDASIDIWAFGCLVYELLTGTALFCVESLGDEERDGADDDHLLDLNDVLEPLPDAWLKKWERADKWFGTNRERLNPRAAETGDFKIEEIGDGPFINDPLETLFDQNKPKDIDATEAEVITRLIRQTLQYEPAKRPTAAQLLEHPWFRD